MNHLVDTPIHTKALIHRVVRLRFRALVPLLHAPAVAAERGRLTVLGPSIALSQTPQQHACTPATRIGQKVVDNLGGWTKSSRFYAAIICSSAEPQFVYIENRLLFRPAPRASVCVQAELV